MQLITFFLGILVVQLTTIILVLLYGESLTQMDMMRVGVPLVIIALMVAFWFRSVSEHSHKDAQTKMQEKFSKERETLKVNAEKVKTKVLKSAQKDIAREAKVTRAKANFKVGMAVAGVIGVGVLFVVAQMFTVGLLMLGVGGGAIGGYYLRHKQIKQHNSLNAIESVPLKSLDHKSKK